MEYQFIWKVKGIEVGREPARNCYVRDLQDQKQDLANFHNCKVSDVEMIYEPLTGGKEK